MHHQSTTPPTAVRTRPEAATPDDPSRIVAMPQFSPEADRLFAEIGRLSARAAHDLRNVLLVIQNYATELENDLMDGEHRELAGEISAAASRGTALTQELLGPVADKRESPAQALDLGAWLEGAERSLRRQGQAGVGLRVRIGEGIPNVTIPAAQLDRILDNLVANARRALRDGGRIEVSVEARRLVSGWEPGLPAGRYAVLRVRDDGIGMSAEVASRAMDPHFTTDSDSGSGLGLAIVSELTHRAGGQVRIATACGRGTAVKIFLPAAPARVMKPTPSPLPFEPRSRSRGGSAPRRRRRLTAV